MFYMHIESVGTLCIILFSLLCDLMGSAEIMTWINWYIIREDLTHRLSLRSLHFHGSYPEDKSYMLIRLDK